MAQVYRYQYKGKQTTKQDKCIASIPLDKARIWLDCNEGCGGDDRGEAPIYLFSQADIVNDSDGNDVELLGHMSDLGYQHLSTIEYPLPNGKMLVKIDFFLLCDVIIV